MHYCRATLDLAFLVATWNSQKGEAVLWEEAVRTNPLDARERRGQPPVKSPLASVELGESTKELDSLRQEVKGSMVGIGVCGPHRKCDCKRRD